MNRPMPRPARARWTVTVWWATDGHDIHGTAHTATYHDEREARQRARDSAAWIVRRWPRGYVRLEQQLRPVHTVDDVRGRRFETGRWQPVMGDDGHVADQTWHNDKLAAEPDPDVEPFGAQTVLAVDEE